MRTLNKGPAVTQPPVGLSLYTEVFLTALRSQSTYKKAVIVRNFFFMLVLFIFTSIWRVVYADRTILAGYTMVQILWYLSFTEVVEMSKSRLMVPIQEEVKEGTIVYNLIRPYSYLGFYLARGFGESIVHMIPMLIVGGITATVLVGPLPGYFANLGSGFVLFLGGIGIHMMLQIIIGLLAFLAESVENSTVMDLPRSCIYGHLFPPVMAWQHCSLEMPIVLPGLL